MSIETATFVVQRGAGQFSCLGSELIVKLLDSDLLLAQRGATHGNIVKGNIQDGDLFIVTDGNNGHKSVTGAQLKAILAPSEPEELDTPLLKGVGLAGEVLTCDNALPGSTFKWFKTQSGTTNQISGQTSATYTCTVSDLYHNITAKYVTPGGNESPESNAITVATASVGGQIARFFTQVNNSGCNTSPQYYTTGITVNPPNYVGDINAISDVSYFFTVKRYGENTTTKILIPLGKNQVYHADNLKSFPCKASTPLFNFMHGDEIYMHTEWSEAGYSVSGQPSNVLTYEYNRNHDPALVPPDPRSGTSTSSITNLDYIVTVVNTGSGNKYAINGNLQQTVYAIEDESIIFDQSDASNSGHPLRIYEDELRTTEITTGVTIDGTTITFVPSTTGTLYYQCQAHAGMGGQIIVS